MWIPSRLLKKTHMLRCRLIASLQRTVSTPPLVDFRAPRIWIFLSSLQEVFSGPCWNPGLYLASTAAWDICSAMPFGSELLPMLKAVPSLSSSNRLAI
jgi:hypothetical protein